MARQFIDTNILVYAFGEDEPRKRAIARDLVESGDSMLSTQVLSEFANVLTRRLGFAPAEVRAHVAGIAGNCEVVPLSPAIVGDALRIMERYRYGFYDSQILAAALAGGAATLYSEDLQQDQVIGRQLRIESPFRLRARERTAAHRAGRRLAAARS